MRSTLIVSAFAALALAAPRPQEIDFDLVDAAPDPIPVSAPFTGTSESVPIQAAAAAAAAGTQAVDSTTTTSKRSQLFGKRTNDGDCSAEPAGTGPAVTTPSDTPQAFLDYVPFHDNAKFYSVSPNVPEGYTLAFSDLQASSQTVSYLGYKTLSKYDPFACQQYCDSLGDCVAFNLFYERNPSVKPNVDNCPNPKSVTNIKCVRWGTQINQTNAVNTGETRDSFKVVISGSNGYNKIAGPPAQPGYKGPVALGGAIDAPVDPTTKTNTYAGNKFFGFAEIPGPGQVQTYNKGVTACMAAATEQGAYNSRHTTPGKNPAISNQVVTYVLSKNNIPQGVYCAIYTEAWATNYATNIGQTRGSDVYTVSQAYAFTNATYAANYPIPVCDKGGCNPYYKGGNCGGFGAGTC